MTPWAVWQKGRSTHLPKLGRVVPGGDPVPRVAFYVKKNILGLNIFLWRGVWGLLKSSIVLYIPPALDPLPVTGILEAIFLMIRSHESPMF